MNFLIEGFPIHAHWDPSEGVHCVENRKSCLPVHHEWVDKEQVPGEWHQGHLGAIWVLKVHGTVLYVIATPQQEFSLTVEFQGLGWLIHLISSLQVFSSSLCQFCLSSVDNLVKVVNLSERTRRVDSH